MIGDNLINREDSCKVGRPREGSRNRESPAQIGRVGTFGIISLIFESWSINELIILYLFQCFSFCFFLYLGFLSNDIHYSQDSRRRSFLIPLYHFYPIYEHTNLAITAESSPLHRASGRTQTGTFGF